MTTPNAGERAEAAAFVASLSERTDIDHEIEQELANLLASRRAGEGRTYNDWATATHAERVTMHKEEADRQHAAMLEAESRRDAAREVDDPVSARVETKRAAAHRSAMNAHWKAAEIEGVNARSEAALAAKGDGNGK